jgi:hypothetical protein
MARSRKPRTAQSNASRQAAYRKRHLQAVDGQGARLNMVVTISARAQLTRLAAHYGVTQRDCLARLLADAERKAVKGLGAAAERDYYLVTQ